MKTKKISLKVLVLSLFWLLGCGEDDVVQKVDSLEVSDLTVSLNENPKQGQSIGIITASSETDEITFSIKSQVPAGAMLINAGSGELTVSDSSQFKFELNPELIAKVLVTDGLTTVTATVNVTLNDVYNLAGDREALITIFNANPGNELPWDIDSNDVENWEGIELTDGRVTTLQVSGKSVSSIPLEALERLDELKRLFAANNDLTELNLSSNRQLNRVEVFNNAISSINITANVLLEILLLESNSLETIDLSGLPKLKDFKGHSNRFSSVNIANGNNNNMSRMHLHNNPDLRCIQVDSNFNGGTQDWIKDVDTNYSSDCN